MKEGPDIAHIAALIGDPARANMLSVLMDGHALTASELAAEAGIGLPTASVHLGKLADGGLLEQRKQGRHKYFTLADADVAGLIEALMGVSASRGFNRIKPGPKDTAMREARVCYNHLAGRYGVEMFQSLLSRDFIKEEDGDVILTAEGSDFASKFGVEVATLQKARAVLCRSCLDWSERRSHLAGSLGRAFLSEMENKGWMKRDLNSRALTITSSGKAGFAQAFPVF